MNLPDAKRRKTPVPPPPEPLSPFGHYYEEVRRSAEAAQLRKVLDPPPPSVLASAPSAEPSAADGDVAPPGRS